MHSHKSGPLKQQNKSHKNGPHRSKRSIDNASKGKVDAKTMSKSGRKSHRQMSKQTRVLQVKQRQKAKRDEMIAEKRALGVDTAPPILVLVYSYSKQIDTENLVQLLTKCTDDITTGHSHNGNLHLRVPRFKLRYEFVTVTDSDLYGLLDMAKVADILLLLHPLNVQPSEINENVFINAMFSHFLPTTIHCVQGIESLSIQLRQKKKKSMIKAIESRFPLGAKLNSIDTDQDALQLLNQIGNCKRKVPGFKRNRPQLLAERTEFKPDPINGDECGTLSVTGFLRSQSLNANQLVHIPGWGDFQIDYIEKANYQYLPNPSHRQSTSETMDEDNLVIQRADPMLQETLEIENEPDMMDGEQTFPTEDEIEQAQASTKQTKRVVKGTSDYQACWILDEDDPDTDKDHDESDQDEQMGDDQESGEDFEDANESMMKPKDEDISDHEAGDTASMANEEYEQVTIADDDERYDEKLNIDEEKETLAKIKERREHELFPDEVDTPLDVPARVRFQRYRGLKNFAYSSWDPKENLPADYARIFQFENFNRTRRRVLKNQRNELEEELGAESGSYITIHLKNVPQSLYQHYSTTNQALIIYGLLQHEQKMSVLNLVIKKHPLFLDPIRTKERLIFHIGCRRYYANPIFSAHTNGSKFRYERFMLDDEPVVATIYAPITYAPASVTIFKEYGDGSQKLAATGSLLSVNPDRMVIKRSILSGHPFKINSKLAVVRYMFYNRDDINWFKPIELRTKYGRQGHIKEPLGTHGHMKCLFDKPIKSQDTVLMSLYKRIYPKWSYQQCATSLTESPRIVGIGSIINFNEPKEEEMAD